MCGSKPSCVRSDCPPNPARNAFIEVLTKLPKSPSAKEAPSAALTGCGGKCLEDRDLRRSRNGAVEHKPGAGEQCAMFLNCPLLPTGDRQHHQVDRLAERRCVVVAQRVLDEHQGTICWNGAPAIAQNLARLCVGPVMNDVLHDIGARP